ncbi:MAG: DUF3151 domain-containing protein [Nocardioidaceae bacterium]
MASENLLGGPPETLLPDDPAAALLAGDASADSAARGYPASSLPWAVLAEQALAEGRDVEAYAYARTGYHRGLDALRRNGWRGFGPVPWSCNGNQGFLRALAALTLAADRIGDEAEAVRGREFLRDCSPQAYAALLGD